MDFVSIDVKIDIMARTNVDPDILSSTMSQLEDGSILRFDVTRTNLDLVISVHKQNGSEPFESPNELSPNTINDWYQLVANGTWQLLGADQLEVEELAKKITHFSRLLLSPRRQNSEKPVGLVDTLVGSGNS